MEQTPKSSANLIKSGQDPLSLLATQNKSKQTAENSDKKNSNSVINEI